MCRLRTKTLEADHELLYWLKEAKERMTKSKITTLIQTSCVAGVLSILMGCGTMGATDVLSVKVSAPQKLQSRIELGSITLGENATRVDAVGVIPWGEFSSEDLQNVRLSIENTLTSIQAGSPSISDKKLTLHTILRRYLVTASGNAAGVIANIAWCAVDESGKIVFHEQFYASDSAAVVGTLGGVKNKVNEAILLRIATVSAYLASADMHKAVVPALPPNAYLHFEQAVQKLPASFRSVHFAQGGGYSYAYDISGKADWNWASSPDRINWEDYLRSRRSSH